MGVCQGQAVWGHLFPMGLQSRPGFLLMWVLGEEEPSLTPIILWDLISMVHKLGN